MDKLKMHSPDLSQGNIEKIRNMFPNCVTEALDEQGKLKLAVDFEQLRQELSGSIVEGTQERYHLNWPGKKSSLLKANSKINKTLRPCEKESINFESTENLFIEGNNLSALKLLEETYLAAVKLIYIDPPYNTGGDLLYNDDFSESPETFLKKDSQVDEDGNKLVSNLQGNGRFHTKWLNMIYPRLVKARSLLSKDGILAISIDDNELSNLLSIVDELFGWENRKVICVKMSEPSGLKMGSVLKTGSIAKLKEYVVICSKQSIRNLTLENIPKEKWDTEYNIYLEGLTKEDRVVIREESEKEENADIARLDKIAKRINLKSVSEKLKELDVSKDKKESWLFENSWRICQCATSSTVLKLANEKKQTLEQDNFFVTSSTGKTYFVRGAYSETSAKPRLQMLFADDNLTVHPGDFWHDIKTTGLDGEGGVSFKNGKKPLKLLKRIIKMATSSNDIILDFFAGSGSTAQAVWESNIDDGASRKFILMQYPEEFNKKNKDHKESIRFCESNGLLANVAELSKQRLRINSEKLKGSTNDIGFRVLKVDSTNMTDVFYQPDQLAQKDMFEQIENIKEDRTDEDLLFQVLLDWGVGLTLPISKQQIASKDVFYVNADEDGEGADLIACFSKNISNELIKELAEKQPLRVVFRDDGFANDSVKINVEQIFKQISPMTDVKSI
ncbi:DNA methylase [Pseudoalteromonas lipolytica SCSIO 04301]|uniref:site-specific DNA-methyltransferase n=1 Tax=Pseudoalteromonas lipolytica TaxID=570156 RepID=UPI000451FAB4|nr:site-specific DNA-methyltransferase [Pseudoalteromonas lipolytica]EWH07477.1 DNA methylase [Pseudoalteromonas lipolytica SCSIO 04301]